MVRSNWETTSAGFNFRTIILFTYINDLTGNLKSYLNYLLVKPDLTKQARQSLVTLYKSSKLPQVDYADIIIYFTINGSSKKKYTKNWVLNI